MFALKAVTGGALTVNLMVGSVVGTSMAVGLWTGSTACALDQLGRKAEVGLRRTKDEKTSTYTIRCR